jgi:CheY-like chemotaxis protein
MFYLAKVSSIQFNNLAENAMAKVLVIDDEPSIATLVAEIIEGYGHQVCIAFNGLQGLEFIKENKFDLIISDIMMPHITGLELLYFVRSNSQLNSTHFVLMSAVAHLSNLDNKYQPEDFLVKPFDITRIDEIVQKFLPESDENSFFGSSISFNFPFKENLNNSSFSRNFGELN